MGGFIILQDGRAYARNNWSYDAAIERIARALPGTVCGREFSAWLLEQRCSVQGPGLGRVDLRELTPANQQLFTQAAEEALITVQREGPGGWCDPGFYPGWVEGFRDLIKMMDSVRKGEPPSAFNPHLDGVIPPSGERYGPGWDHAQRPLPGDRLGGEQPVGHDDGASISN